MEETSSILPEKVDPLEMELNRVFDQVIDLLNGRRKELINNIHVMRMSKRSRDTEYTEMVEEIKTTKRQIETGLKQNPLKKIQQEMVKKLEEKLDELHLTVKKTHIHFKVDTHELELCIAKVGEIIESDSIDYSAFKPVMAVGVKGKAAGELNEPRGVAINPANGHIYVTEVENKRVSIFSEKGEYVSHFGEEIFGNPHGIAIHNDDVYVSDIIMHAIFHLKLPDFKLVKQVGKKGSGKEMFSGPSQVYLFTNGDLYVPDWGNSRISILSPNLKFKHPFKHTSMTFPCHVKIIQDLMYVLSSKDNPCMHVFTLGGEKIRSFITRGDEMQVLWGGFFCIDQDDNIVISDFAAHSIKVFSSEGILLHTIGEKGREVGKFESPHGIALTQNSKLVCVSGNNNFCLQIFSA